jgi:heat-inducible transcriptional repressor
VSSANLVKREVKEMEPAARKQQILSSIVQSFIKTGEPVGSKALISESGLKVSSATVRNDMAELTEKGYIAQPHTSAGRVPTELGYRYYVDNLMKLTKLSERGRDYIYEAIQKNADSPESILQSAADVLSRLTNLIAVATTPGGENARVRKISFVPTGAHTAMAVVIASNGVIKTRLFRCEFVLTPEMLGVFDKALNQAFAGVPVTGISQPLIQTVAAGFGELSLFMTSALVAVKEACAQAAQVSVCHSGYGKLMYLTGANLTAARRVWEFLQNGHDLAAMLERLPLETSAVIGTENSRVELSASSVVSARYTIDGNPSGVAAVIGPLRMDYAGTMAILECVVDCVSSLIGGLIEIQ